MGLDASEGLDALIDELDALDIEDGSSCQPGTSEPAGGSKYLTLSALQEATAMYLMLDHTHQGAVALVDLPGRLNDIAVEDETVEILMNELDQHSSSSLDRQGWVSLYCRFQQVNHTLLQEAETSAAAQCARAETNPEFTPTARADNVAARVRVGLPPPLKANRQRCCKVKS